MQLTCVWSFVDKPAVGFNRYKNMSCRIKSNNNALIVIKINV